MCSPGVEGVSFTVEKCERLALPCDYSCLPAFISEAITEAQVNCIFILAKLLNKQWSMDLNSYLMANSSHKQLPVFIKPLPQFAMLSEVSYFLLILKGIVTSHFSFLST